MLTAVTPPVGLIVPPPARPGGLLEVPSELMYIRDEIPRIMTTPVSLHTNLRLKIAAITGRTNTREELNDVIAICHAIAAAFVQCKRASRALVVFQGYTFSDLGYDCIADLFHQDDRGEYIQLKTYFEGLPAEQTDAAVLSHLRRLVFSKVNHRIFRIYNELDPGLGRILRNVKLAVQALNNFTELERYGELYLVPACCETLEHLPPPDQEALLRALAEEVPRNARIPELLACISRLLRRQTGAARLISLLDVSMMIRNWYSTEYREEPPPETPSDQLTREDTLRIVRESCRAVFESMRAKYVQGNKLSVELFCACCETVEESVVDRLVENNGRDESLFTRLQARVPSLTDDEYRTYHRSRLEYLARQALARALQDLKREF